MQEIQFGQDAIRDILTSLGGRATESAIAEEAKRRYRLGLVAESLSETASINLNRMRKWGEVTVQYDKKERAWFWVLREQRV